MARQGDIKPTASGRPPFLLRLSGFQSMISLAHSSARAMLVQSEAISRLLRLAHLFRQSRHHLLLDSRRSLDLSIASLLLQVLGKDARPVCRNGYSPRSDRTHRQAVSSLAQQKADPYTRPVIKAATPWSSELKKCLVPSIREADKRGRLLWKKRIDPARRRAIKRAHKHIDPYLRQAQAVSQEERSASH